MRRVLGLIAAIIVFWFLIEGVVNGLHSFGDVQMFRKCSMDIIHKSTRDLPDAREYLKSRNLEEGSANVVTSIVVSYRSFDTLGEVTVLFAAALGTGLLLSESKRKTRRRFEKHNVLSMAAGIVLPFVLLLGGYVIAHGHVSPGGGFPGGTIIALASLLLYVAYDDFRVVDVAKHLEQATGAGYVVVGLIGLAVGGAFLMNFLPTGLLGSLFSAGVVPFVYVLIGLKVGAELSSLLSDLREG